MSGISALRSQHDPDGMLDRVIAFPEHMADAWARGQAFAGGLSPSSRPKQIVVCGMGGSAIGGDMVRSYLGDQLGVALHVNRNYAVPAGVREDTLWVFSSYSGNTGETLAAYEALRGSGAAAVAVSSGGRLTELCREDGVPVCEIPGGMPPRSAIAYSFFPLVNILAAYGVASADIAADFAEASAALSERAAEYGPDSDGNAAFALAERLHGTLPFVYSCGGLHEAVARRWACQFNENSKSLAHFASFPELNHNEIVGFEALPDLRSRFTVVSLEDGDDHPNAQKQAEIALEIIEPQCAGVIKLAGASGFRMTRILSMMILGDFASVYLAYLNGVDPTPVKNIDFLKSRLKQELG